MARAVTRIHAYWNLRLRVWSLRDPAKRRRVEHVLHVELVDVDFRVQLGGRAAVLRSGVRRVHAYVAGQLVAKGARRRARRGRWVKFTYNPFRAPTFVVANPKNPRPIYAARRVRLDRDGAWCQEPLHSKVR